MQDPSILRGVLLVFSGVGVAFPLTLIRNLDRLSVLSIGSLIFYSFFIVQLVISSHSNLTAGVWSEVIWWRTSGVLKCLPIFSLAFCCQRYLQCVPPTPPPTHTHSPHTQSDVRHLHVTAGGQCEEDDHDSGRFHCHGYSCLSVGKYNQYILFCWLTSYF